MSEGDSLHPTKCSLRRPAGFLDRGGNTTNVLCTAIASSLHFAAARENMADDDGLVLGLVKTTFFYVKKTVEQLGKSSSQQKEGRRLERDDCRNQCLSTGHQ